MLCDRQQLRSSLGLRATLTGIFCVMAFQLCADSPSSPPNVAGLAVDAKTAKPLTKECIPQNIDAELRALLTDTFSADPEQRALAASRIGEIGSQASPAIPFLIRLLGDQECFIDQPDPSDACSRENQLVWILAADSLVRIGVPSVAPLLAALGDAPTQLRGSMVSVLARIRTASGELADSDVVKAVMMNLLDPELSDQGPVLKGLDGCTDPRLVEPLLAMLAEADRGSRELAARAFCGLRDERAVIPLLQMAQKDRGERRGSPWWACGVAVDALGHQKSLVAVKELVAIGANGSQSMDLRRAAVRAMGRVGGQEAFGKLAEWIWDDDMPVGLRCDVARAMAVAPDKPRVSEILTRVLWYDISPFELKACAAEVLGKCGTLDAVPVLLEVRRINGANELAFLAAMSAVKISGGKIGDAEAIRIIEQRQTDEGEAGIDWLGIEKSEALCRVARYGTSLRARLIARGHSELIPNVLDEWRGFVAGVFAACVGIQMYRLVVCWCWKSSSPTAQDEPKGSS